MGTPREFQYRLPDRTGGWRPGSHRGTNLGTGQEFLAHAPLHDRPDPRRLDLRASLRTLDGNWLVRVHRQRAGIPLHLVVDVSSSMRFGARRAKLDVAADFAEALGQSAFRVGDALGMRAFDARDRDDLFMPALVGRGIGSTLAAMLRQSESSATDSRGLLESAGQLSGRRALVFLVSDFQWPLDRLERALDLLARAWIVPVVVWDPAELEPPAENTLAALRDAETGARRTLWVRPTLRDQWRQTVADRRRKLDRMFASRAIRPFYAIGAFDAEAMSAYFFEVAP
jgi:hypothetical protein